MHVVVPHKLIVVGWFVVICFAFGTCRARRIIFIREQNFFDDFLFFLFFSAISFSSISLWMNRKIHTPILEYHTTIPYYTTCKQHGIRRWRARIKSQDLAVPKSRLYVLRLKLFCLYMNVNVWLACYQNNLKTCLIRWVRTRIRVFVSKKRVHFNMFWGKMGGSWYCSSSNVSTSSANALQLHTWWNLMTISLIEGTIITTISQFLLNQ